MVQRRQANQGGLVDGAPFVVVAAVAPAGGGHSIIISGKRKTHEKWHFSAH